MSEDSALSVAATSGFACRMLQAKRLRPKPMALIVVCKRTPVQILLLTCTTLVNSKDVGKMVRTCGKWAWAEAKSKAVKMKL